MHTVEFTAAQAAQKPKRPPSYAPMFTAAQAAQKIMNTLASASIIHCRAGSSEIWLMSPFAMDAFTAAQQLRNMLPSRIVISMYTARAGSSEIFEKQDSLLTICEWAP